MAIPNTGTLNITKLKTEFGGANPAPLSRYYRGAGFVPSTRPGNPGTVTPPTPGGCQINDNSVKDYGASVAERGCDPGNYRYIYCGNAAVDTQYCNPWIGGVNTRITLGPCENASISVSGGSIPTASGSCISNERGFYTPPTPGGTNPPNPPTPINGGVPTSGTIKLSNFYGSTKT